MSTEAPAYLRQILVDNLAVQRALRKYLARDDLTKNEREKWSTTLQVMVDGYARVETKINEYGKEPE